MTLHVYRLLRQTFGTKIVATSKKFQFHGWFKMFEKKNEFNYKPFSFNVTVERIQLYKFHLQNCL